MRKSVAINIRQKNEPGLSAAYYLSAGYDNNRKRKGKRKVYPLPKINTIIIINELVECDGKYNLQKSQTRGCYYVVNETSSLIICKEFYNKDVMHSVTFLKSDFLNGLIQFKKVDVPMYRCEHSWNDYDLKNIN